MYGCFWTNGLPNRLLIHQPSPHIAHQCAYQPRLYDALSPSARVEDGIHHQRRVSPPFQRSIKADAELGTKQPSTKTLSTGYMQVKLSSSYKQRSRSSSRTPLMLERVVSVCLAFPLRARPDAVPDVRIKDHGLDTIEVSDNGSGIAEVDWPSIGTSSLPSYLQRTISC